MDAFRSREGEALRFFELDDAGTALVVEAMPFLGTSSGELELPFDRSAGFGAPAGRAGVDEDMNIGVAGRSHPSKSS
jgi:hypothetical protein